MEVAPGVHRLGSAYVNWYLVEDGDSVTVIDAGVPVEYQQLLDALQQRGRTIGDVEAIVLTHAHVDHLGFAERARTASGAPVRVHTHDHRPGARRFPPLHLFAYPTSWPFLLHSLKTKLLLTPPVQQAQPYTDGDVLDVPGRPRVVHVPGHTRGSCALHLADRGLVFTGDALVTFDPYLHQTGPRTLLSGVNEDTARARTSLITLAAIDADIVLPGHGDPWTQGLAKAVDHARTA